MARYWCERCGRESNTLSDPHLCKDVAARLRRRERQIEAVEDILRRNDGAGSQYQLAEAIVTKLARMGVQED